MWSKYSVKADFFYCIFTTTSLRNQREHFSALVTRANMVLWSTVTSRLLQYYLTSMVRSPHLWATGIISCECTPKAMITLLSMLFSLESSYPDCESHRSLLFIILLLLHCGHLWYIYHFCHMLVVVVLWMLIVVALWTLVVYILFLSYACSCIGPIHFFCRVLFNQAKSSAIFL